MAFFAAARAGASRLLVSVSELSELTKPTFVNGRSETICCCIHRNSLFSRWRKPKVSARRAADIRKDNYKETGELIRDELKPVVEPRMKMNKWWRELPKR